MRIGLLLDTLMNGYQQDLLLGAHEECVRQGVDLYCLVGGILLAPDQEGLLYDLVTAKHFDGLAVISGTIIHSNAETLLPSFLGKFPGIPLVSIAGTCGDIPTIEVDNGTGVRDMVVHLAKVHGKKRIAFIRVDSPEGHIRYQGYQDGLAEAGLPLRPELIVEGDFTFDSGVLAVRELREVRRVAFDAMVSSSDWMAIGFMDGLHRREMHVPRDVAVVGFDDIEESRFCTPPLTTIAQPIRNLGTLAIRQIMSRLRGEPPTPSRLLATRFCGRDSCGCDSSAKVLARVEATPGIPGIWALIRGQGQLLEVVKHACPEFEADAHSPCTETLVEALLSDFQDRSNHQFLGALQAILARVEHMGSLSAWHKLVVELRAACLPVLAGSPEDSFHAGSVFEQAHILISRSAESLQGRRRLAKERQLGMLSKVGAGLRECFEHHAITRGLVQNLDRLDIPGLFVALQRPDRSPDSRARLLLSFDAKRSVQSMPDQAFFEAGEILPKSHTPYRRHSLIVLPLRFGIRKTGLCAIEMGPNDVTVYEAIREQINGILQCSDSREGIALEAVV